MVQAANQQYRTATVLLVLLILGMLSKTQTFFLLFFHLIVEDKESRIILCGSVSVRPYLVDWVRSFFFGETRRRKKDKKKGEER